MSAKPRLIDLVATSILLLAGGCGTSSQPKAGDDARRAIPDPTRVITLDESASSEATSRAKVSARADEGIEIHGVFSPKGEHPGAPNISAAIYKQVGDAEVLQESRGGDQPEPLGDGKFSFGCRIRTPKKPGEYLLRIRAGTDVISEATLTVE